MCKEADFIKIAKRENNKKRNYLVVNELLGKHMPVSPGRVFHMFDALADVLKGAYGGESLLLIGFAETATAIGARIAVQLKSRYIQTTREEIPNEEYLFFTEAHSHAAEQKLVRKDIEEACVKADRIVFIEDEVTTGNTIWNIISILKKICPSQMRYSVASLLNGMEKPALDHYKFEQIQLHYLIKTSHARYGEIAESYCEDGTYIRLNKEKNPLAKICDLHTYINTRRCTTGEVYEKACENLWEQVKKKLPMRQMQNILLIGTEEFMYPALYVGVCLEQCGCTVKCHSTTRSPIAVSADGSYPLHCRYELESLYQRGRKTYLYDLAKYDRVIIFTDAPSVNQSGLHALLNALCSCGNDTIQIFRWCEK